MLIKALLMQSDFPTFLRRKLIYGEVEAGQLTTLALGGRLGATQ